MQKKVSIIVPVYNVKPYLNKCVNTLICQDYDNIEIILVDDGSTDGSGKLCDDIALANSMVRVIHQDNQGLSSARNIGTNASGGEFIAYIDSDDWVTEDYISHQMKLVEQYNADIVVMRQQSVWDGQVPEKINYDEEIVTCYDRIDALETMIYGYKIQTSACKLFRRELMAKHPFPIGELYEDSAIMHQVFSDANIIITSSLPLYCYRRRAGSIINERFDTRHLVILEHSKQLYNFIKNNYPSLLRAASYRCAYSVTELAPKVIATKNHKLFKLLQDELCKHYEDLIHDEKAKRIIKIRGFAVKHGMVLTKIEVKAEKTLKRLMGKDLYSNQ